MSKSDWLRQQREAKSSKVETAGTGSRVSYSGDEVSGRTTNQGLPAPRLRRESGGVTPTAQKTQATESRRPEVQGCASVAEEGGRPSAPKRGRPRLENQDKTLQATKPWVAAGMSERTWYRRRVEKRAT